MKRCSGCSVDKEFTLFPKNSASPDGYYSVCKACRKVRSAAYRVKPDIKARETARLKAHYEANKERCSAKRRARYAANPQAALAQNREWREKNIDYHRAQCRKWAKDHPEEMRIIVRRRRAHKLAAEGSHTVEDIRALFAEQAGLCVYCHADLNDGYHVDHIYPLSRGGSEWPTNLQLLCPTCNRRKADKLPSEFAHVHASP